MAITTSKIRINKSTSGDTVIVFLIPSNRIIVVSASIFADNNVDITFKRDFATPIYAGPFHLSAMGGFVLPENESGWFQTGIGDPLVLNSSAAVVVSGSLSYRISTT